MAKKGKRGQKAVDELLAKIAAILKEAVEVEMKQRKWTEAYLDVRGPSDGSYDAVLMRVRVQMTRKVKTIRAPAGVVPPMDKVWEMRDGTFPRRWYGFKVVVRQDGQIDAEFHYDPKCIMDPAFLRND